MKEFWKEVDFINHEISGDYVKIENWIRQKILKDYRRHNSRFLHSKRRRRLVPALWWQIERRGGPLFAGLAGYWPA